MDYNVKDALIKSLVHILKPPKKLEQIKSSETDEKDDSKTGVVDFFVQQAAAAKTIGILVCLSNEIAEQFLSVRIFFIGKKIIKFNYQKLQVIHNLIYAMGNEEYAESQRQASNTLEVNIL